MKKRQLFYGLTSSLIMFFVSPSTANESTIILQSTTSTANSGLYNYLLPIFERTTGIKVHVVAVGTGQALKNARNGDGDVLLVHAKSAEEKFVNDGFGVKRFDVMRNNFVIVGPPHDPASISGLNITSVALNRIANSKSIFVSRGDHSGTHWKEQQLWSAAQINPLPHSGKWYRETGSGMGATLNIGVSMGGYVLTDRATWISFKNKNNHSILVEGDKALTNQYGIILINPVKHERVNANAGQRFINWILSPSGQKAIAAYTFDGKQLFLPNAVLR